MTNFEKIKQMTVEEFAKELHGGFNCDFCKYNDSCMCIPLVYCAEGFLEWLNEEVKTDERE